ncbi:MAG TPA: hypothetical protein VMI06_14355 [Terriglobia bacterium]|nr:hypothetical protein [Terriglobia bacterium]
MQVVLLSKEELIQNTMAVCPEFAMIIARSIAPWQQEAALALFLQEAFGRAPVN